LSLTVVRRLRDCRIDRGAAMTNHIRRKTFGKKRNPIRRPRARHPPAGDRPLGAADAPRVRLSGPDSTAGSL
jgi:hypothetical protein